MLFSIGITAFLLQLVKIVSKHTLFLPLHTHTGNSSTNIWILAVLSHRYCFNCTVGTWDLWVPGTSRMSQCKCWGTFNFWDPYVVLFWQIIYFSPGKIAGVCICAEAAAMPTLQNTGHLKNSRTEKKYCHRRYGLFLILFIKAAIMPAEERSTHRSFGRFPERKAVSPAFNLEVHFLTIPSWLIITGDKRTA